MSLVPKEHRLAPCFGLDYTETNRKQLDFPPTLPLLKWPNNMEGGGGAEQGCSSNIRVFFRRGGAAASAVPGHPPAGRAARRARGGGHLRRRSPLVHARTCLFELSRFVLSGGFGVVVGLITREGRGIEPRVALGLTVVGMGSRWMWFESWGRWVSNVSPTTTRLPPLPLSLTVLL